MRNTFAKIITELAAVDEKIVYFLVILGIECLMTLKKLQVKIYKLWNSRSKYDVSCFRLATGMKPFIYTIAPFTTSRCLEQIKIGAAFMILISQLLERDQGYLTQVGQTHHSLEDMSIISSIPNMRVLAPCDSIELTNQLREIINLRGPTYIRIGKKGEPNLFDHNKVTRIGKAEIIKEGCDFLIVGVGPIIFEALKAGEYLEKHHSISICIASLGGINPLDTSFLEEMKKNFKHCFTLEGMV